MQFICSRRFATVCLFLSIVPTLLSGYWLTNTIRDSFDSFLVCASDKKAYLVESDSNICCLNSVKAEYRIGRGKSTIFNSDRYAANIMWVNFNSIPAYLFLLFLTPTLVLILSKILDDKIYAIAGFVSLFLLYGGASLLVYGFLTDVGS